MRQQTLCTGMTTIKVFLAPIRNGSLQVDTNVSMINDLNLSQTVCNNKKKSGLKSDKRLPYSKRIRKCILTNTPTIPDMFLHHLI